MTGRLEGTQSRIGMEIHHPSLFIVGGFNLSENFCQIGSFPQIGMKITNI